MFFVETADVSGKLQEPVLARDGSRGDRQMVQSAEERVETHVSALLHDRRTAEVRNDRLLLRADDSPGCGEVQHKRAALVDAATKK